MTAGWAAASVRGSALVRRLVGPSGAREVAGSATWGDARAQLATTFYGRESPADVDRDTARTMAATAAMWQLRVLAGWLPVGASGLARLFAAPIEIANIEAHLENLDGAGPSRDPVPLGSLGVAWRRVAATTSPEQVRTVLTHSPWGDPGGAGPVEVAVGLRVAWARRLMRSVPETVPWAKGGLAVLIAREVFAFDRAVAPVTGRELDRLMGKGWRAATSIAELAHLVPEAASWPLAGIESPTDLWNAERNVARRVDLEATQLADGRRFTRSTVAAMMTLVLLDLRRIMAAVELAGRGPDPTEVFDAVA